jgi:Xaa-Pro aminopeptidase
MNRNRASDIMALHGLDAVVGTSVNSVRYALGYEVFEGDLNEFGQAVVIPRDEDQPVVAVLHSLELGPLLDAGLDTHCKVQLYSPFGQSLSDPAWAERFDALIGHARPGLIDAIAAALDMLTVRGRVAVERHVHLSAADLTSAVDGHDFVDHGEDILYLTRLVKTPAEVEMLRRAAAINESAMQAAIVGAGDYTVAEAGSLFTQTVVEAGGVPLHFLIDDIGVWRNWGFGGPRRLTGVPGRAEAKLRRGALLQYDAGVTYHGYWSDLGGVFLIGAEPSAEQRTIYAALSAGVQAGMETIRPGMKASELNKSVVSAIRANGLPDLPDRPGFGHFIGLTHSEGGLGRPTPTDSPYLPNPFDVEFAPNMVFNFELPFSAPGKDAYQYEITVVVTDHGAVRISPFKSLQVVV